MLAAGLAPLIVGAYLVWADRMYTVGAPASLRVGALVLGISDIMIIGMGVWLVWPSRSPR